MYNNNLSKWGILGIAVLLGVVNITSLRSNKQHSNLPTIPIPTVGEYSSYEIIASKDGYQMKYRANDPLIMKRTSKKLTEEYTINSELYKPYLSQSLHQSRKGTEMTDKELACLEAGINGKSQGKMAGAAITTAAAPTVTQIPVIGWLAQGWVTMWGSKKGGEIGNKIGQNFEDC
tara:strand:+ start:86 stop:610 length:525 start_codon:yes stop_codon:yes gene_type:complete